MLHKTVLFVMLADALLAGFEAVTLMEKTQGWEAGSQQDMKPSVQQPAPKSFWQPQEFKMNPFPSQP